MLSDKEKDKLIARLISTNEGRQWIIDLAKKNGTLENLSKAIFESVENIKLMCSKRQF
jgi:hypothetical protein